MLLGSGDAKTEQVAEAEHHEATGNAFGDYEDLCVDEQKKWKIRRMVEYASGKKKILYA